jgi:uncharacterized membrane protein
MSTRQIAYAAVLAALYVVIGQFLTPYLRNPMVPGAIIAINMVVVVVAGILFGPTAGALVGFVGTLINALFSETGSRAFEFGAIIPHTIMGLVAGVVARGSAPLAALTILVGHALNILVFIVVGLLPLNQIAVAIFWGGLALEALVDVIVIWLAVAALRPLVRPATT